MTGQASIEVRRITDVQTIRAAEHLFDHPIDEQAATRFLATDGHHLLLAFADGRPVGMISGVELTHPDKGTEMFLYELGVDEPHRRRGVGSRLVRELAALAQSRGCYGMWVLTDRGNDAARATYRRAGGIREDDQAMLAWTFATA